MDPGELRNLKEFLLLYNKISEDCFKKCVINLTQRGLDNNEEDCIARCTQKHINVNHKTMEVFAEINPGFQQRKAEERQVEFKKMQDDAAKILEQGDQKNSVLETISAFFGGGNKAKSS